MATLKLNKSTFDSRTVCLKEVQWLPVKYRILFRLLCISFKCVYGQAPADLMGFFKVKDFSGYCLRSASYSPFFFVPKTYSSMFGDRAFSVAGPREWNRLPSDVKNITKFDVFKKKLKTHLFASAYV